MEKTAPAPRGGTARRWAASAVATVAWTGTAAAAAGLAFAYALPERLTDTGPAYERLAQAAFFGRVFTFHLGWALLAAAAVGAALRRWRLAAVAGLAAAAALVPTLYACRPHHPPPTVAGPPLRVMAINLLYMNADYDAVANAIAAAQPDLITCEEYTAAFDLDLRPRLTVAGYASQCCQPRDAGFGLAVFSRRPFVEPPRPDVSGRRSQVRVVVRLGDRPVAVYAVHPLSPHDLTGIVANRLQVADYLQQLRSEPLPTVMAGDWNFTAETANAASLRAGGLHDAFDDAGVGRASTWPMQPRSWSYLPGVRIDHVYLTRGLASSRYATGQYDGSDHLPIIADVAWTR